MTSESDKASPRPDSEAASRPVGSDAPTDIPALPPVASEESPPSIAEEMTFRGLLSRFADGDDSALGELIEREGPRVLRRLEARIPNNLKRRVGASDILQHTMVDLLAVRERYQNQGVAAFRKLLSTMADLSLAQAIRREHAKKRDIIREHSPPRGFAVESRIEDPVAAVPAEQTSASRALSREEAADAMRACYRQLSKADQEIIRLVDYEGLDYAAVAERLDINAKAAQKRHSRAIERLRESMRHH